jgi:hypothetical protein
MVYDFWNSLTMNYSYQWAIFACPRLLGKNRQFFDHWFLTGIY